ncbi:MAG: AsmA-like C-terminal region-containing protein [Cyanobacteria bacterium]|nr:AsmA-like C-terminal region-containing protein [Cyanobacteriota bacterium]
MKSPLPDIESKHRRRTIFRSLLKKVALIFAAGLLISTVLETVLNRLLPLDALKSQIEETINQTVLSKPRAETGLTLKLGTLSLKLSWAHGACAQVNKIGLYETDYLAKNPSIFIPRATICIRAFPFLVKDQEKQVSSLDLDRPNITLTPEFLDKLKKIDLSQLPERKKNLLFEDSTLVVHAAQVRLLGATGDSSTTKSWLKLTSRLLSLKHLNSTQKAEFEIDQMSLSEMTPSKKSTPLPENTLINSLNMRLKTAPEPFKPGFSIASITENGSPEHFFLEAHKINAVRLLCLYQPFMKAYTKKVSLKTLPQVSLTHALVPRIERVLFKKTTNTPFYYKVQGDHPLLKQWEIESEPSHQSILSQLRFKADGIKGTLRIGQRQPDQGTPLVLSADIPDIRSFLERLRTADIQAFSPVIKKSIQKDLQDSLSFLAKYLASGSLKSEFHWDMTSSKSTTSRWPTGTITLEKLSMPKIHLAESRMSVLLGADKISSKFTGQLDRQPLTVEAVLPLKEMKSADLLLDSGPLNLNRLNALVDDLPSPRSRLKNGLQNSLHNLQGEIRADRLRVHLPLPFDSANTKILGTLHLHHVQAQTGFSRQSLDTPSINGAMAFSSDKISLNAIQLSFTNSKDIGSQALELQGVIALKNQEIKNDIQIRTAPGADFKLEALNPFIQQVLESGVLGPAIINELVPPQSITVGGLVQVNARVQGQWKNPLVSGTVKLKEGYLNAAFQASKGRSARTFLVHHTNGSLTLKNKILLLQPLSLTWNQIQWKLSGRLSPTQSDLWMLADIPDVDPLYQPFAPVRPYILFDTPFSVRHIRAKAQSRIHWVQQRSNNLIDGSLNLQAVRVDLGPNHPPIEFNQLLIALRPGPDIRLDIAPTQGKWGSLPLNLSSAYRAETQQSTMTVGPIDAGVFLNELKSHNKTWAHTLANHTVQGQFSLALNTSQTNNTKTARRSSVELILHQLQWDTPGHHISNLSGNILGHIPANPSPSPALFIESENLGFDYNQRLTVQAPFSLTVPSSKIASSKMSSGVLHLGVSDIENQHGKNLFQCELPWELMQSRFNLQNAQCQLHIAQNTFPLTLQGSINNIQQPLSSGYQWELASAESQPELSLKLTAQNPDGLPENLTVSGHTTWQDLNIPFFSISKTSGKAVFTGTEGSFSVSEFRVPGLDAQLSGKMDDLTHYPFRLSEVTLQGKRLVVPLLQKYMTQVVLEKFQKNWLEKLLGPLKPEDPAVPFEFQAAPITYDSVVYDDVLLSQYYGKLAIFPTGYFELNDVRFKAAGGEVSGALSMDPLKKNHMSLSLNLHKVKVNPLAKTLLNAPNVIFGDMDGKVQVSSQGETDNELVKNADGTVGFVIENGRLPAVAKLETILTAANLLRGGIAGLSLNNLFRALSPLDTNYFAKLSGDFRMLSGVGHTENLLSSGKDLSLSVKGRVNMLDAAADLQVIGAMSQNVNGVLGHFGKANLTSALHWIPVLGTLPNGKEGIIYHIPGLGYIPGLGGIPKDVHRFQVNILGPVNQLRSIKDFRWLTE